MIQYVVKKRSVKVPLFKLKWFRAARLFCDIEIGLQGLWGICSIARSKERVLGTA